MSHKLCTEHKRANLQQFLKNQEIIRKFTKYFTAPFTLHHFVPFCGFSSHAFMNCRESTVSALLTHSAFDKHQNIGSTSTREYISNCRLQEGVFYSTLHYSPFCTILWIFFSCFYELLTETTVFNITRASGVRQTPKHWKYFNTRVHQ